VTQVSACTFRGDDLDVLYITTSRQGWTPVLNQRPAVSSRSAPVIEDSQFARMPVDSQKSANGINGEERATRVMPQVAAPGVSELCSNLRWWPTPATEFGQN
jgi:hypothetical protein